MSSPQPTPTQSADTTSGRRAPRRGLRLVIAVVVAFVLIGAGAAAVSAATSHSSSDGTTAGYRTATVSTQSVEQTIENVGVIEPVSQAAVAFPTGGTVESVAVKVGDTVALGDQLAKLDLSSLQATLTTAEANLASAELTLHQALNGETITANTSGGTGGSGGTGDRSASTSQSANTTSVAVPTTSDESQATVPTVTLARATTPLTSSLTTSTTTPTTQATGTGSHSGGGTGSGSSSKIAAAEQAVIAAQKQVDADLAIAARDLATANQVCGTTTTPTTPTEPTTTTTTTPSTTTTTPSGTVDPAACAAALQQTLTDQQTVAADQKALAAASVTLDKLVAAESKASTSTGTGTGTGTGTRTGTGSSRTGTGTSTGSTSHTGSGSGTTGTGGSSSTSTTPTAAELVQYQAAVDTALLQVEVAEQGIAQATIVTPINGTVVAVNLAVGDTVTAGSSTDDIVVQGTGGYEVSTTVTVDQVSKVKVGQTATVVPDGQSRPVTGKVVAIGIAADTSGNSPVYPVVIGFSGSPPGLLNGQTATVRIVIDQAQRSLAVPTSAVTTTGTRHTVTVISGGKPTATTVETGAVGATYTAITSGLTAGQVVALADLSAPLPSSATATTSSSTNSRNGNGTGTGAGGFGGGGFGGGGFGGGGARPGG